MGKWVGLGRFGEYGRRMQGIAICQKAERILAKPIARVRRNTVPHDLRVEFRNLLLAIVQIANR
jgi:hypothetical protein